MKSAISPVLLFLALCALQIAVPLYMIGGREHVLKNGKVYKFKTAPVDPYDPFRGKYVALRMESSTAPWAGKGGPERGQAVYAAVAVSNGYAYFSSASDKKPESGEFIKAKASYSGQDSVNLVLPFDRYYAEESMAPQMETAYRANSSRTNRTAYVSVRVLNGHAVLEELYIDDVPIKDYVRKSLNKTE